jgi:hypothetical protein
MLTHPLSHSCCHAAPSWQLQLQRLGTPSLSTVQTWHDKQRKQTHVAVGINVHKHCSCLRCTLNTHAGYTVLQNRNSKAGRHNTLNPLQQAGTGKKEEHRRSTRQSTEQKRHTCLTLA